MKLEPMSPKKAVEQYLASREIEVTDTTLQDHRYRLKQFRVWADETGLDNMNDVTGRKCEEFKNWRIRVGGLAKLTLEQHLRTFRIFINWCESNNAVREGVADKIIIPRLSKDEQARDEMLEYDKAERILDYLIQFEFASMHHIVFHILWHTGMRRGALHALDLEDWNPGENYLAIRSRDGTRLKLGDNGERNATIADNRLVNALGQYIEHNRPDVEDEFGRNPLIATKHGRAQKTTIQGIIYKVTRPCFYTNECPHDREIETCEATYADSYSKCPTSLSPHPIRRGSITAHLNKNVPMEHVSERANVSVDTLELHYDGRSHEEKRENREKYLDDF